MQILIDSRIHFVIGNRIKFGEEAGKIILDINKHRKVCVCVFICIFVCYGWKRQTDRHIHSDTETEKERGHYIGEKILNDQVFPFPYT